MDDIKLSKIKEITKTETRDWPHWIIYYFDVVLEDSTALPIKQGKKTEAGYKVGEELKYTIQKDGEYEKIFIEKEPYNPGQPNTGMKSTGNLASFAMSYAKDLVVGKAIPMDSLANTATSILTRLQANS